MTAADIPNWAEDFERYGKAVRKIWLRTEGKAWEPPDPKHPLIELMIKDGFIERCDGRSGFEMFKDSMVKWTKAGQLAMGKVPND